MLSVSPGTCAGKVHAPRTMRSIFTPLCPARMSAATSCSSVNAFILATMRVGSPVAAARPSASICETRFLCRSNGASHMYAPEKISYAIERYSNEARRIYGVLDKRLTGREWVASDDYSIADIAIFPWLRSWQNQGIDWADFPHLKRWFDRVAARPAVQRGVEVLASLRKPFRTDAEREVLFGATQYERR